jgi:hypothetical protein
VAVDRFTKWIEVRTVATVTLKEAAKFIEDITHRFGVPNRIVTDLGKSFTGSDFWNFCQDSLIDVYLKDRYGEPERGGVNGSR